MSNSGGIRRNVIPAEAGILRIWKAFSEEIPAYAGMTVGKELKDFVIPAQAGISLHFKN